MASALDLANIHHQVITNPARADPALDGVAVSVEGYLVTLLRGTRDVRVPVIGEKPDPVGLGGDACGQAGIPTETLGYLDGERAAILQDDGGRVALRVKRLFEMGLDHSGID